MQITKILILLATLIFSANLYADTEVVYAVGTGDDRFYEDDGSCAIMSDGDSLMIGYEPGASYYYGFGIVFDSVDVPKGATISSVVLRMTHKRNALPNLGFGVNFYLFPLQADSQATLNGTCWETGTTGAQSITSGAANDVVDFTMTATDFTTLFARANWKEGNSLAIYAHDDGTSDDIAIFKSIASYTHTLTITYTTLPGMVNVRCSDTEVGLRVSNEQIGVGGADAQ